MLILQERLALEELLLGIAAGELRGRHRDTEEAAQRLPPLLDIEAEQAVRRNGAPHLRKMIGIDLQDVRLVADNVSLSKELRGELDITALQHRGVLRIRDLVSDADKLDALGRRGLQRLAQYQVHLFVLQGQPTSLITNDFLRIQAQAHLLHRPAYLKTKTARWAGERLLHTTRRLLASDAELDAIIERAVAQPAAAARVSPA